MAIFRFFKMAAAAILDFSNFKFLTVARLKRAELRRRAKLGGNPSKRGRDMAIFQDGGRRHRGFFKFQMFNGRTAEEGRTVSPCQIWSKSAKPRPRYPVWRFFDFQDGGRPPSWICYVCVFGPPTKGIWWSLSLCKIWLESMH